MYTKDSIILAQVFQETTDGVLFKDFIEELLLLMGKWLVPKSVLVMNNAFFHHGERIQ